MAVNPSFFENRLAFGLTKPKRVLMTADTVGGVWNFALELATALGKQGIEVVCATMGAPLNRDQRAAVRECKTLEIYESSFKLEWMQDPWKEVDLAANWLLKLEENLQPDVIHLNGYAHAALPWHAPTLVVAHSCVLSWWLEVRGEPAPGMWTTYRERVTQGLDAADAVVAPSRAMVAMLNRHYGQVAARVIPNGRDSTIFAPRDKEPFILTIGRVWDEAKNIALLGRIAPELSWPVYVAGEQRHPDGGTARQTNVEYLGPLPVPDVAGWLGRAAIYALPARYEPFGLSVLEAGMAGCALVLGDIPSLRENWDDAAVFVPPNDADSLLSVIEDLIADPERREALGVCARARACKFTPEKMAAAYLAVYTDLMVGNHLMIKN